MSNQFKITVTASGTTISVFIINTSSSSATYRVELYNDPPNGMLASQSVTLSGGGGNTTVVFPNLAPGDYGVVIYDETNGTSEDHSVTTTASDKID